jgi:hypothetical protein
MPCCSTKCPICILLYSNLVCCCWSSLYFPPLLQGDVEAVDPGNKAVAEPVGDVAAAEHERYYANLFLLFLIYMNMDESEATS